MSQIQQITKISYIILGHICFLWVEREKNYKYLSLSTKKQEIMYDGERKTFQLTWKEKKSHKILKFWWNSII